MIHERITKDARDISEGLTEDDYTTTSEERGYAMLNSGEVGVLAFASWAYVQARDAGEHGEDIGYMAFPITVNGKPQGVKNSLPFLW